MGMFDEVKVEFLFPDPELQDRVFQTKDFNCALDQYTITKDGRLVLQKVRYEDVPEEERPYFGTPEWDESVAARMCGVLKRVPIGTVEVPHHGDISIYTTTGSREAGDLQLHEYTVRFTYGKLEWIKRVDR